MNSARGDVVARFNVSLQHRKLYRAKSLGLSGYDHIYIHIYIGGSEPAPACVASVRTYAPDVLGRSRTVLIELQTRSYMYTYIYIFVIFRHTNCTKKPVYIYNYLRCT